MRRSRARPEPILRLYVPDDIRREVCRAVDHFNQEFIFRYGPPLVVYGQHLLVHFHDISDFLSYLNRTAKNEFSIFRLKKQAENLVRELPNGEAVLKCLKKVRWNDPSMLSFSF